MKIMTDTGIFPGTERYSRTVVISGWHPDDERLLGQVSATVHRLPSQSVAEGSVWVPDGGWVVLVQYPSLMFWSDFPGYRRWESPKAASKMDQLIEKIASLMAEIAVGADV